MNLNLMRHTLPFVSTNGKYTVIATSNPSTGTVSFVNSPYNPVRVLGSLKGETPSLAIIHNYPNYLVIGDDPNVAVSSEGMIYVDTSKVLRGINETSVSLTQIITDDSGEVIEHTELFCGDTLLDLGQQILNSGIVSAKFYICSPVQLWMVYEHDDIEDLWMYIPHSVSDSSSYIQALKHLNSVFNNCEAYAFLLTIDPKSLYYTEGPESLEDHLNGFASDDFDTFNDDELDEYTQLDFNNHGSFEIPF